MTLFDSRNIPLLERQPGWLEELRSRRTQLAIKPPKKPQSASTKGTSRKKPTVASVIDDLLQRSFQ